MNGKQPILPPSVFSSGIFAALPEGEWRSSPGWPRATLIERKTPLFSEGTPASDVYLVCSGLIKTFKSPSRDRVQIINIASGGDVLGTAALSRDTYQASATALTRSIVFRVPRDYFLDFMNRKPQVSIALIRMMNDEFQRIHDLLVDLGTKKALPRVASCLLLFMEKQHGGDSPEPFNIPISRQEMGAFLGLSPETVSRQLKSLVTGRIIKLDHKRLTVTNLNQLKSIAASG